MLRPIQKIAEEENPKSLFKAFLNYKKTLDKRINYFEWEEEKKQYQYVKLFIDFLTTHSNATIRTCFPGHFTGSALVVNSSYQKILLTHHKKLNLWLQLGGHADGNYAMHLVAYQEAKEESGLNSLQFFDWPLYSDSPSIFNLDLHWIPSGKEPGHFHYDLQFLLIAPEEDPIKYSPEESHDLNWFTWEEASKIVQERTLLRGFQRAQKIFFSA